VNKKHYHSHYFFDSPHIAHERSFFSVETAVLSIIIHVNYSLCPAPVLQTFLTLDCLTLQATPSSKICRDADAFRQSLYHRCTVAEKEIMTNHLTNLNYTL